MFFASIIGANSQTTINNADTTVGSSENISSELKGTVLDIKTKTALPYTNIYVLHKNIGAISNEKGDFLININGLEVTDTIRFQYIGYSLLLLLK
jgi:hypothetical protein